MEVLKKVSEEFSGMRLDKVSSMIFENYSRTQLKKWIIEGRILLNNELASPREIVSTNDEIEIYSTQLTQIVDFMNKLDEVDTSKVESVLNQNLDQSLQNGHDQR